MNNPIRPLAMMATRRVSAVHRDLYRRPFDTAELGAHDAVILDPPRSGALPAQRCPASISGGGTRDGGGKSRTNGG